MEIDNQTKKEILALLNLAFYFEESTDDYKKRINKVYEALTIPLVGVTLKEKQIPKFEDWKTEYFNTHFDGYINKFSKEFTTKEDVLKKYNSIFKISL